MGNAPSVDAAHQRPPHKLSKPRVGNATTVGSMLNGSTSNGLSASVQSTPRPAAASAARFSTFRPAPPPDLYPYEPAPSPIAVPMAPAADRGGGAPIDRRQSDRMATGARDRIRRSLFRSKSSQGRGVAESPRERRLSVTELVVGERLGRTNSLAAEHGEYASYYGRPATDE